MLICELDWNKTIEIYVVVIRELGPVSSSFDLYCATVRYFGGQLRTPICLYLGITRRLIRKAVLIYMQLDVLCI